MGTRIISILNEIDTIYPFYGQDLKLMHLMVYIHVFILYKFFKKVSTLSVYTPLDALTLNHVLQFEMNSLYFIK
jgi:hypothetical protein